MTPSPSTQAILLLTTHFPGEKGGAKPLTPTEWGRFAEWLKRYERAPEILLTDKVSEILNEWQDRKIPSERLSTLLDRGQALALSMEKWLRSGLWVMTRSDPDYPKRLKQRLRQASPAVLFGCGERRLLSKGGLAVVGSRKAADEDLEYSRRLGERVAQGGYSVVSGGARGVDEAAMRGALDSGGTAIGVLAERLLRSSSSAKYRRHLVEENLVLVSPFNPEAGFNAGNAMARNKYIYCLAEVALAVHSGKSGGTWNGARENLKRRWIPIWVKPSDTSEAGNAELIRQGAGQAPECIDDIRIADLFGTYASDVSTSPTNLEVVESANDLEERQLVEKSDSGAELRHPPKLSLYELFVDKLEYVLQEEELEIPDVVRRLQDIDGDENLTKKQVELWLKRAEKKKEVTKLTRPVRYKIATDRREKSEEERQQRLALH